MIVKASIRFGVSRRFTAYVAVDSRVVADGSVHRVVQPVEAPASWELNGQAPGRFAPQYWARRWPASQ